MGAIAFLLVVLSAACSPTAPPGIEAEEPLQVNLTVDGETYNLTTQAANVRELLDEAGIVAEPTDEVTPPPFTLLSDGMSVTVVRVEEEITVVEQSLPFERKMVRSEALSAGEPPRIIQGGRNGLQEITVRTVYRDGVESERQQTKVTIIEEPLDEIVMVGVGATPGAASFSGLIAYNSGGTGAILRGSTVFPEQLDTGGQLDGRVFRLSPNGDYLLYTRVLSDTGRFNNELWLLSTERGAEPRSLGVENVLWADWNPARVASLQIAYTTGNAVSQPPGWEANNDLWVATIYANETYPFAPERIVEAYPATYGWWGGTYAWSPGGRYIAYAYADEVGIINLEPATADERRRQLESFPEFNTRAEWVWLPTITWSPDGRFLAFSSHGGSTPEAAEFDIMVASIEDAILGRFVEQAGMWSHPQWSPADLSDAGGDSGASSIAFLQAANPLNSLNSSYSLWLMDNDGSNARQVYPPVGENSRFPREEQYMAWGPSGRDMTFVFDGALYLFAVDSQQAYRVTEDDTIVTRPTWAPYGAAIEGSEEPIAALALPEVGPVEDFLPEN